MEYRQSPINMDCYLGGTTQENDIISSLECIKRKIIEELDGKELCLRRLYYFKEPINSSEVEIAGFQWKKYSDKEIRHLFIRELKWRKELINSMPIITSGDNIPRELITGIHFPEIELTSQQNEFSMKNLFTKGSAFSTIIKPKLNYGLNQILSTNVFPEKEIMINREIVETEYLEYWLNPEFYNRFISNLFSMIDSYQFAGGTDKLSCIPNEYHDMYNSWEKEAKARKRV